MSPLDRDDVSSGEEERNPAPEKSVERGFFVSPEEVNIMSKVKSSGNEKNQENPRKPKILDVLPTSGFTPKQREYIAAYLGEAGYNATQAARIAGYKNAEGTARDHGRPDHKVKIWIDAYLNQKIPSTDALISELLTIALVQVDPSKTTAAEKRKALEVLLALQGKATQRVQVQVDPKDALSSLFGKPSSGEEE